MRFLIKADANWAVTITSPDKKDWRLDRQMRKIADPAYGEFPLPPAGELPLPQALHYDLCIPENGEARAESFKSIVDRKPGGTERFGRYLFEALLGETIWEQIIQVAEEQTTGIIELALCWSASERSLHQFPWEMMHGPNGFLAAGHTTRQGELVLLTVTRIVDGPGYVPPQLELPPRILFVIGASLTDEVIRTGTELLGVLRQFKEGNRSIHHREVDRVTPQRLQQLMSNFKPEVVHFICHGDVDSQGGFLEFEAGEEGGERRKRAHQLAGLLAVDGKFPKIVILSACHSAGVNKGQIMAGSETAPLAARLVSSGVPIVIGMSGRVSDRACRVFTRQFAQALVCGTQLLTATAQGRRAVFLEGNSAYQAGDWASPAVFMSAAVPPDYAPTPNLLTLPESEVESSITRYQVYRHPVFCARMEFLEAYYELFESRGKSVLAGYGDQGYGKSRLLQELTAQALRDGHVPFLIGSDNPLWDPPRSMPELIQRFLGCISTACLALNLAPPSPSQVQLLKNASAATPGLDSFIQWELQNHNKITTMALKLALQKDLTSIVSQARKKHPRIAQARGRPVVLLDQLHEYDKEILGDLFESVLDGYGLGTEEEPIPVIVVFSPGNAAFEILKPVLERPLVRPWLTCMSLGPFRENGEDMLAYENVLLHPFNSCIFPDLSGKAWAFNPHASPDVIAKHQKKFREFLKGKPTSLSELLYVVASYAVDDQFLIEADDEVIIKKLLGGKP